MPRLRSSSSSQSPARMSKSSVRDALLASVAWTALAPASPADAPPVSSHISQLSTVPKASSPRSAAARAPGTWSSSQASLVPEK